MLLLCVGLAAALNVAGWWWPSRPVAVGSDPHGAKVGLIDSVSFAPFRRGQGPLDKVYPSREQIEEDIASLKGIAKGIRTYTSLEGMQVVPEIARRYGIEMTASAWLGQEHDINEKEVAALIEQANRYPDVIKRVIVGNEVLLRKDLKADELIGYIRRVKAAVKQPVSYADVWEYWLQNPQLLNEVDFITVHFLPYWEDQPVGVDDAMPHILWVYDTIRKNLPGKPVLIGEVGWPSEGRSRRAAVPTRTEAATFITDFLRLAQDKGLEYNLVEAFDQPWKVALEGTVGGSWGVLDEFRHPKYELGGAVSNLPQWPLIAAMAVLIALIVVIPRAQRVAALPPGRMLAAALFAQGIGAFLAATLEYGLEHNYSTLRFAEFVAMGCLQAVFAAMLYGELLDRLQGLARPAVPLRSLDFSLQELRRWGWSYLPFRRRKLPPAQQYELQSLRRIRFAEWLFALFAVLAAYQCLMLVVAGRYRDFPLDYFLLPAVGFLALRLTVSAFGAAERGAALFALGFGFGRVQPQQACKGRFRVEAILGYLLLVLPVLVLVIERLSNREAIYWSATAAAYSLPLLANLLAARNPCAAQTARPRRVAASLREG